MRAKLKRGILLVLLAWDGMPMPESSLVSAVQSWSRKVTPAMPTDSDVVEALKNCQAEGYVAGVTDEFSQERTWSLTNPKGIHQARQLPR